MILQELLLQTKIDHPIKHNESVQILKAKKQSETIIKLEKSDSRNYIDEFKNILVHKLKSRWLNSSNPNKKVFSATEVIECPKQTWYKLKGKITEDMLDDSKFFYLLDVYARMGDTVHEYVYKTLKFQKTEERIVDEENHISGKFDIYDNGILIDIKSPKNKYDVSPQLSVYYYLVNSIKKYPVEKVFVWWVLQDEFEEYDVSKLKELYPKYLDRAKKLYTSLSYDDFPESLGIDEKSCKYCPLESWCKGKTHQKVTPINSSVSSNQNKSHLNKKDEESNHKQKKSDDIIFLL